MDARVEGERMCPASRSGRSQFLHVLGAQSIRVGPSWYWFAMARASEARR